MDRLQARKIEEFQALNVLVTAIFDAAKIIAGGQGEIKVNDQLKRYRSLMFPEAGIEAEEKAKATKKVLEQEFNRGGMRVQRLDYGGKRKQKRDKIKGNAARPDNKL